MSAPNPTPIAYDKYGRMRFHPDYHAKQKAPWTTSDEKYLIENYTVIGPEQVSLALERTIQTVMTRAYELRKAGRMVKPTKRAHSWRMRSAAASETR